MKFGLYIKTKSVAEWKKYYLNYKDLKKLLGPIKIIKKNYFILNYNGLKIQNVSNKHFEEILKIKETFKNLIYLELEQISEFFLYILMNSILLKFGEIKLNLKFLEKKNKEFEKNESEKFKNDIKSSCETLFKEILYLLEFSNFNIQAFYKILKKYQKITKEFPNEEFDIDFINNFNEKFKNSDLINYRFIVSKIQNNLEILYLKNFYNGASKKDLKEGNKKIRQIYNKKQFTQSETFYLGLFFGIVIVLFIILIILIIQNDYLDFENKLFGYIYPLFRGSLLFILYIFFLGINIFVFIKNNVNYALVLKFKTVNMTPINYITLSFFFCFVWLVIFVVYLIILGQNNAVNQNIIDYIPPIIWILFIFYLIFPFKIFNYKSRLFLLYLLKELFLSPFFRSDFLVAWVTDQFLSFITSLKDFAYTICYVIQLFLGHNYNECSKNTYYIIFELFIIFFPLLLRVSHCLRNVVLFNKLNKKQDRNNNAMNMGKYTLGILTSLFSLMITLVSEDFFYVWIVFVVITTIYSYLWDIKKDWGFLQKNSKNFLLRNHLSYDNKIFYYFGLFFNLVMRLAWILSISAFVSRNLDRQIVGFFLGLIEIIRRSIWNFFRIENEHLKYIGTFNAVGDINLPKYFISELTQSEKDKFIKNELKTIIENDILLENKQDEFIVKKTNDFSSFGDSLASKSDINQLNYKNKLGFNKIKNNNTNNQEFDIKKFILDSKKKLKKNLFNIRINKVYPETKKINNIEIIKEINEDFEKIENYENEDNNLIRDNISGNKIEFTEDDNHNTNNNNKILNSNNKIKKINSDNNIIFNYQNKDISLDKSNSENSNPDKSNSDKSNSDKSNLDIKSNSKKSDSN